MKYITTIDGTDFAVEVLDEGHVILDGKVLEVNFASMGGLPVYSMIVDGKSYEAYVFPEDEGWQVLLQGRLYPVKVEDENQKRLRLAAGGMAKESTEFHLRAPMPGLVVALPVAEGQAVKKGQVLVILESMKMQNELRSPRTGTVGRVRVKAGESVEQRQALLSVL